MPCQYVIVPRHIFPVWLYMSAFTAFFVHKCRLSSRGVCTACPKPRVRAPVRRSVAPSVAAVVSPTPRTLKQTNLRQRTLSLTILTQRWCKQSTSTAVSSTVPVIASRVAAIARRASHNRACSTCHWPVLVQIIQFQPIPNGNLSKKNKWSSHAMSWSRPLLDHECSCRRPD